MPRSKSLSNETIAHEEKRKEAGSNSNGALDESIHHHHRGCLCLIELKNVPLH